MARLTKQEFIDKARKIHGDLYDYSKVNYVNNETKVCIICPAHGEFWQTPQHHLRGHKCPKCRIESRIKSANKFIEQAKEVHGNKYDYSKVKYVNCKSKVCIICPEHGEFWQTPDNHLCGNGCLKCAKITTTEDFIKKSNKIHHNEYDYTKTIFKKSSELVCIICPKHGEFWQTPNNHLSGQGCPDCNTLKNSKIVQIIENKLKELNISYEKEKTFEWLKNKSHMYLDFYLPDYNTGIECQGIQHFRPINFFGGNVGYEDICKRDELKYKLCKEYGINLLYFNYNDDINNFESILKNGLYNIIL